ncbi:MAG: hypothetical protein ACTSX6_04660 [Candidatus Heimdallarchaeaceae archaeon]
MLKKLPSEVKLKKSVALSRKLCSIIHKYGDSNSLNFSQVVERSCWHFLNNNISTVLSELEDAKERAAVLQQKLNNLKERKQLVKDLL